MDGLIGSNLGSYRVLEQIGMGGMATVYKAYHPATNRYVAIKVLPQHLARDLNFRARFQREAHAIAHLEHRHILPLYDVGEDDGIPYLVMRYTDGGTLSDLMANQVLSIERAVVLISQVAEALDYAHQQGIVHRDVKPANVLIGRDGNALLADFGIAKIIEETLQFTGEGERAGTPAYMAPEQIQGELVDARSDIYSLGVVLYLAVTGEPPFSAETPLAIMLMHLHNPLRPPRQVNPSIPEWLEGVILRAMAKDPADRFQTAAQMAMALHDTQTGLSVPPIDQPPRSAPSWQPWFVVIGAILGALALVGLFNIRDRFIPTSSATDSTARPTLLSATPNSASAPTTIAQQHILIDTYHGLELFDMRGADGAMLRSKGFVFDKATGNLTLDTLSHYNVLIIWFTRYEIGKPHYSPDEIQAVREFLNRGGGVFLIGLGWVWADARYGNSPIADYPLNQIAEGSGIFFTEQFISEVGKVKAEDAPITFRKPFMDAEHPITQSVAQIAASKAQPGTLTINAPAKPIIWGDDNTKDSNGVPKPIFLASSTVGQGRLVALQHLSYVAPFVNDYDNKDFPNVYDNLTLFENILTWLSSK